MDTSKDASKDDQPAVELSRTIRLAVQAFDGHQLSDEELEGLCDAVLCGPLTFGEEAEP